MNLANCQKRKTDMKKNSKYVQGLGDSNDITYHIKNSITTNTIQFRVIRYIVDKEVYYLGTTLRDSLFTIDVLKDLYWMRWNIETFFKTIKYRLRRI